MFIFGHWLSVLAKLSGPGSNIFQKNAFKGNNCRTLSCQLSHYYTKRILFATHYRAITSPLIFSCDVKYVIIEGLFLQTFLFIPSPARMNK
jgi:hypothetical protein